MQTEITRRALLGGAGLALAVASAATTAAVTATPRGSAEWHAAKASLNDALAYDKAINAAHSRADKNGTLTESLEAEWDRSGALLGESEWSLFDTSAPDLAALEWKIAMLQEHQLIDGDIARTLIADVRHLRGGN